MTLEQASCENIDSRLYKIDLKYCWQQDLRVFKFAHSSNYDHMLLLTSLLLAGVMWWVDQGSMLFVGGDS